MDQFVLKEIRKLDTNDQAGSFIDEFKAYIQQKQKNGLDLKYQNGKVKPEYLFLSLKLAAIEKVVTKELGKPALSEIKETYEKEMIKRILEEREQKL